MSAELPLTIKAAAAALRSGELSSVDLTTGMLDRIARSNESLGAFVTVLAESALAAANAADRDLANGMDKGPLQGIPLAIKDIVATADAPTMANSRVYDPALSGTRDAVVVSRLRGAGAVLVGKSTTSEFALGMPDADKGFPIPRNPWNLEHTAGGSSSGTGIAVAAGLALGGLGTDTGGSVRFPAAVNGHTGLKVTFGRVPKSGVVPLAYTLDSVGPMARTAYDCAVMLEVMAGHDASDPDAATADVPRYSAALDGVIDGMTVGVPVPYFFDAPAIDDEVRTAVLDAVQVMAGVGARIVEIEVPYAQRAKEANAITLGAEAFAYHRNDLVNRWDDYGRFTRTALIRGALLSAGDYAQAQRFRSFFSREVAKLFSTVDVLVTPTWPVPSPRADDWGPERMITSPSFTGPWNLCGLPAVAVPCGFSSAGLPMSMQIVGPAFGEGTVLRMADAYQSKVDWQLRVPSGS